VGKVGTEREVEEVVTEVKLEKKEGPIGKKGGQAREEGGGGLGLGSNSMGTYA
jgi:hypothetical protein